MSRRFARTSLAAATLVAAAATLTLAGCSSSSTSANPTAGNTATGNPGATAPTTGAGGAPGSSAPVTSAPATSAPGTSAPGGGATAAPTSGTTTASLGSPTPAGPGSCTSSELTVVQSDPGVGAGQYYSTLVFTNTSGHSCTLTGFPGVSYVAADGQQSGNPATRTGDAYRTVTLAPHGTAKATLHDANGMAGYDPGQCQLTAVKGLRIYPPGEKAALFLPWETQHCAGASIHSLTIGPLTS
ncbi:DUF4232 domain-containing protein [Kitasatospora sp. NBC_01250]|uniref:DUF4232 domain-containing protein n=1 Tax=unclassified Kitasatospora TaxID=2633591 RepID=UPI002E0F330B|nr:MULTISPECIES: DUF4232 domain-containing protein [unclassified Kitasatospora]WSJ70128.1 DUF4232 domain-containing protein [Kitasatospora sp. NBC_01302]